MRDNRGEYRSWLDLITAYISSGIALRGAMIGVIKH